MSFSPLVTKELTQAQCFCTRLFNPTRISGRYCTRCGLFILIVGAVPAAKQLTPFFPHPLLSPTLGRSSSNGVPAITLCKLLGSTLRVVEQFYLRTSDANDKFAVDVLDRLMGDGDGGE